MKLGLTSTLFFTLIIFFSAYQATSQSFNVAVSCQKCLMTCGVANCYRVSGVGYDRQTCPTVSCTPTGNYQISTISACTTDFLGNTCRYGQCFSRDSSANCANIPFNRNSCDRSFRYVLSCGTCPNNELPGCSSRICFEQSITYTDNSANPANTYNCLPSGATCSNFRTLFPNHFFSVVPTNATSSVVNFGSCTKRDARGSICGCCYTFPTAQSTLSPKICTQSLSGSLFSSTSFVSYIQNMTSTFNRATATGNVAGLFQGFTLLSISSILVLVLAFFF